MIRFSIVYVLVIGMLACDNSSKDQTEQAEEVEFIEEAAEMEAEVETVDVEKEPYRLEAEKFGNAANFPDRIRYVKTEEVRGNRSPSFRSILKDYGDFFLTEFVSIPEMEGGDEMVFYITFDKSGEQIDLERIKLLNSQSNAWEEFITDTDIRVRYAYQPMERDEYGNTKMREDPYISYQHFSIEEDGRISRIFCESVDGKYLNVVESYAVMPEEYVAIEEEGMKIPKHLSEVDLANGYLEANNGQLKMAVFNKDNGYNISLLQRTTSDMCCEYYQIHAAEFSNNELCEHNDITSEVIPEIDTSQFFMNTSDYELLKDILLLDYKIPHYGTALEIMPVFCDCELDERGITDIPEIKSMKLKWNKTLGKFEY